MYIRSTFACLLLLVSFTLAIVSIGIEVPPSGINSADLVTELNLLHQELYSINDAEKEKVKAASLRENINSLVNDYVGKHSCVRYYLKEYFTYKEEEIVSDRSNGLFIKLHFTFDNLNWDSRKQYLNLLFLDKKADVLRKINKYNERHLDVLLDYPLVDKSEEYFNQQYFDICIENVQYDKSWNSKSRTVDTEIEFTFGLDVLSSRYQKFSELMISTGQNLIKLENEIDQILKQYNVNLKTSEPELRNKNEDTLNKYMVCFAAIFIIYVIANVIQITWLIKYLKSNVLL